jgi:hypothetical protein
MEDQDSFSKYFLVGIIILIFMFTFLIEVTRCPSCEGWGAFFPDHSLLESHFKICLICGGDGRATLGQWILGTILNVFA